VAGFAAFPRPCSRGTAYGWVTLDIDVKPRDRAHRDELTATVWKLINDNGISIGSYNSGDYGSGREIHINFKRMEGAC
jgi:hypothetical protein